MAQGVDAHFHAGDRPAVSTDCWQSALLRAFFFFAKDIQAAKHMIALLLVNEMRNLGDMKHSNPPQGWRNAPYWLI